MKNIDKYALVALLCITAFSCNKDNADSSGEIISALYVRDIFYDEVTAQADLNRQQGVVETGFYVSDTPDPQPETAMKYLTDVVADKRFTSYVTGLERATKYYLKAYALDQTGDYHFGRQITFTTSNTVLDPVVIGPAAIADGDITGKTAIAQATVTDLGGAIRLEEYGAYVWVKDDPSTRRKISVIPRATENIGTNSTFRILLDSLMASTDYSAQVYARNARREQLAEAVDFHTMDITAPQIEMVEVRNVTSTTALVECRVTGDGDDPYFSFGIYRGTTSSPSDRLEMTEKSLGKDGYWYFTALSTELQPSTDYYFQGWVQNDHSEAKSAVDGPHKTLPPGPPTIETVAIENNVGIGSASATLKGLVLSDGGSAMSAYGIRWGVSEGDLTEVPSEDYDPYTGLFSVTLSDLSPVTTYYYQAYVTNASGNTDGEIYSFSTGINGGRLYIYDTAVGKLYQGETTLDYFELPPLSITVTNLTNGMTEQKTVWLLDRNLGALEPFPQVSMTDDSPQGIMDWTEKYVGYFYQWGRAVPGMVYRRSEGTTTTPTQMDANTFVSGSNKQIQEAIGWTNDQTLIPQDNQWPSSANPCPPGYRVPTLFEFQGIAKAVAAAGTGNGNWNDVYTYMRLGKTGFRQGGGNTGMANMVSPGASAASSVRAWENWGVLWTATAMKASGNRTITATANVIDGLPAPAGSPWPVNNASSKNAYHFTITEPTSISGEVGRPHQMDLNYLITPRGDQATLFNSAQYYDPWQQYGFPSNNRSQTAGLPVRCARFE
jgi:hypothetical protein